MQLDQLRGGKNSIWDRKEGRGIKEKRGAPRHYFFSGSQEVGKRLERS